MGKKKPLMTAWTWEERIRIPRTKGGVSEDEAVEIICARAVESCEEIADASEKVLEHLGERRRFVERRVRKGPLKGHVLPGFTGRIVGLKRSGRRWVYLVETPEGHRRADYRELEIVQNRRKKKRKKKRTRRKEAADLDLVAQLQAALAAR